MKLVFLGTSGAQPTQERSLSCICLVTDNEIIMFDDFARLFDKQGKNRFLPFKELNGIFDHKDAYETSKKNNAWRWPEGILNE